MRLPEQGQLNPASRLNFLTDVTALGSLCSPAAVTRLRSAVESLNSGDRRSFLRGYRLAVATPLHGLLWFVVDCAELLGLQNDDRLSNWLHYRRPRGESLLSAVSDPTSDLSRLCYVFNDLEVALRKAEGGLPDTVAVVERCRATARLLNEVVKGTEFVSLDTGEELPGRESLLRVCLAERVLDYLEYDPSILHSALELVWSGGEGFHPLDDRFISNAETHLDSVSRFPLGKGFPVEWRHGLWFGFDLVAQLNGITLPTHSDSDLYPSGGRAWFKELLAIVNPSHPQGKWPSMEYGLTEFSHSAIRRMISNLEVKMETVASKHRLTAILGPDTVRLMTSAGGTDAVELEVILAGAVACCGDSPVRLLLLTHSVASDDREWVSVAIRLPMYGTFSNASKWFLFYKMYHKGYVFDTDVAHASKAVRDLLLRFEDSLEVEEIDGLDSEDFLPLCVLPAFRAMRELSQRAVEVNADLRSGNSELLAALWLLGQGYCHVNVSFRRASLGKFEYDAIGVKDGQCLVLEVKGANFVDDKLQREIGRFTDKVDHLRGRLPALTQALGCESGIESVSGRFIFLGDLDNFKPSDPSIPLLGYDDFVEALKVIGLPPRIVDLLDRSYIIHSVRGDDFPHDPFFAGL